jgi:glycosyltransferase involved in cell wall biosynthesis
MDLRSTTSSIASLDERVSNARPIFIYNAALPESVGSIPLHALIPARHVGAKALYFGGDMDAEAFLDRYAPRLLIITKMFDDAPLLLARAAAKRGIGIIGVFCDLHVVDKMGGRNRELCALSNAIVAPTGRMAAFMKEHFGRPCEVIEEPVEYPRGQPRFAPGQPIRVLWIGHPNNHDTLPDGLRALARFQGAPLSLAIVSSDLPDLQMLQKIAPSIRIDFLPWSPLIQYNMLDQCDLVFIPSHDSPVKQAKGQARVIATIQAGRVAVAHPLPQYEELADFCFLSRDYVHALEAALADPARAIQRITAGQRHIDERFSQEKCADKWRAIAADVLG